MLLSRSFVLGLFVYVRQAALSLDRAPASFSLPMRDYYDKHRLPSPARVTSRIDATLSMRAHVLGRLFGSWVAFNEQELMAVRDSLHKLQAILDGHVPESNEEKVHIRLSLAAAEELIRRKLGKQSNGVEKVEHLNETPGLGLKPLSEMAGVGWPDSN